MTCIILLPVDGSDGALRAARHVVYIASNVNNLEVHLVNVQPPGDDWMVRRMIKQEELAKLEQEWSELAVFKAKQILQDAGIKFAVHVTQGEVAPTLVRLAGELGCSQIVMGTRGLSTMGDLLMGSIAHKVLHLSPLPVTLVK